MGRAKKRKLAMENLANKPFFVYHWDSAYFWLEVPRDLFEQHMNLSMALDPESKISENRRFIFLEWQSDGQEFLKRYLMKDHRAQGLVGGIPGIFCDPRSGVFSDFFECITQFDGPVSFIRCLPPIKQN